MTRIWTAIASLWTWLVLGLSLVLLLPVVALTRLVTAPFDQGRYVAGRMFRWVGVLTSRLNPLWRFRWTGSPPPDPRRPYVVVSNHESFADILLISLLPWEMKWLSKIELFRLPVVGWLMTLAGDVPVKRGFGPSAIEAMRICRARLADRVSVMIFPEGTRTTTDEMLPFKDGAFRLAIESGVPILPLVLTGTRRALPKRGFMMRRADAMVRVLDPIETAGLSVSDTAELRDRVRAVIADARTQLIAGRHAERVTAG